MLVSEAMTSEVETVSPDQPIQDAARFMLSADTGVLPVIQNEVLQGMITDRDIAVRAVAEGRGPETPVGEVMTGHALFVYEDQTVEDAAALMSEQQIRRLAVKSRDGDRLAGIISLADISRVNDDETAAFALEGITEPGGDHNHSGND